VVRVALTKRADNELAAGRRETFPGTTSAPINTSAIAALATAKLRVRMLLRPSGLAASGESEAAPRSRRLLRRLAPNLKVHSPNERLVDHAGTLRRRR
jgi:hypothetical protein